MQACVGNISSASYLPGAIHNCTSSEDDSISQPLWHFQATPFCSGSCRAPVPPRWPFLGSGPPPASSTAVRNLVPVQKLTTICWALNFIININRICVFITTEPSDKMWHRGPVACRFWLFLFYHILHCICFKIPFSESKYLVSNWSYILVWVEKWKKWKNLVKSLRFFVSS